MIQHEVSSFEHLLDHRPYYVRIGVVYACKVAAGHSHWYLDRA
jgi:hypothetical protein